jgi:ribosomal protein S18 acetylase RimI-like enzyme
VLGEARAAPGVVGVRLYVEHENLGAVRTYERLGFRVAGYHVLETEI